MRTFDCDAALNVAAEPRSTDDGSAGPIDCGDHADSRSAQPQGHDAGSRLLTRKFGPLPAGVQRRLADADEPPLLSWFEHVLTATRREDMLH